MRAAVIEALGTPLVVKDVSLPQLGDSDVLVEIKACGVCFTDLKVADSLAMTTPLIPGHEPVGIVAETGMGVGSVNVGDRVAVHSLFTCGVCEQCMAGEEEACVRGE
jgi:propanol-preferring alcohol dehydrogenase